MPTPALIPKTFPVSKHFKNISVVAAVTMVSRVLGLGRDMLVTAVFGTSALADAFYSAYTLPNLFRRLLGEGALTAALVPTLHDELRQRERAGAFALVNQVASWLFVVTGGIVVVSMAMLLQAEWFVGVAQGWGVKPGTAARWLEAADLAIILFPYLVCVCLAAAFSAALQTLHRFLEPALSPVWLNLAIIGLLGGAVWLGWSPTKEGQLLWLCGGALLGGVLQMAVPAVTLMREGWQPRFTLAADGPLRQIVTLMAPTIFGSAIYLVNMSVSRFVGLSLKVSAVTVLNLATRLMELPIGVFTVAISTVVFPLISKYAAARDWDNLGKYYRKGMRLILVLNVPAAVGLMVLATPIVRLLFQRGAFGADDTAAMRPVLVVFAVGLPFFSFVNLVLRAFYAQKDTKTPVRAAAMSFLLNLALSIAFMRPLGTVGLALASQIAIAAQAWYLQAHLARKGEGLHFRHLSGDLAKVIAASVAMGVTVWAAWWAWSRIMVPVTKASDSAGLALMIVLGVASYGAVLWRLKIEGREDLAAVLAKVRAKFS